MRKRRLTTAAILAAVTAMAATAGATGAELDPRGAAPIAAERAEGLSEAADVASVDAETAEAAARIAEDAADGTIDQVDAETVDLVAEALGDVADDGAPIANVDAETIDAASADAEAEPPAGGVSYGYSENRGENGDLGFAPGFGASESESRSWGESFNHEDGGGIAYGHSESYGENGKLGFVPGLGVAGSEGRSCGESFSPAEGDGIAYGYSEGHGENGKLGFEPGLGVAGSASESRGESFSQKEEWNGVARGHSVTRPDADEAGAGALEGRSSAEGAETDEKRGMTSAVAKLTSVGTATIVVDADLVDVSFDVTANAKSAQSARMAATKKLDDAKNAAKQAGIKEEAMDVGSFRIEPEYSWNEDGSRKKEGWVASATLTAKAIPSSLAGTAIEAVTSAGAGVSNLEWKSSEQDAAELEAVEEATRRARAKAEALAKAEGLSLGEAVDVSESTYGVPLAAYAKSVVADGANGYGTNLEVSDEISVTSTVTATYEALPGEDAAKEESKGPYAVDLKMAAR